MPQGIAEVNDISIWWEDFGDSSNPSILLIMGANANCMHWPPEFIEPLVDAGFHVIRYDNRDVGKTTWLNKEPLFSKLLKFLPSSIQIKFVDYIFGQGPNEDGVFTQNPDDASKFIFYNHPSSLLLLPPCLTSVHCTTPGSSSGAGIHSPPPTLPI